MNLAITCANTVAGENDSHTCFLKTTRIKKTKFQYHPQTKNTIWLTVKTISDSKKETKTKKKTTPTTFSGIVLYTENVLVLPL